MKYILTRMAEICADKWSSRESVLAQAKVEIGYLIEDGLEDPSELIFHTIFINGDWDRAFYLAPRVVEGETVMLVDVAAQLDGGEIEAGPHAGKTFTMPVPASEGREEE